VTAVPDRRACTGHAPRTARCQPTQPGPCAAAQRRCRPPPPRSGPTAPRVPRSRVTHGGRWIPISLPTGQRSSGQTRTQEDGGQAQHASQTIRPWLTRKRLLVRTQYRPPARLLVEASFAPD
jgi:hypothetical protein